MVIDDIKQVLSESMKTGEKISFSNVTRNAIGLKMTTPDGAVFRFNLMIGQQAEFVAGNNTHVLTIHDAFEDLVGVGEPEVN